MSFKVVRMGGRLLLGESRNAEGTDLTYVEVKFVQQGGKWRSVIPHLIKVSEQFFVNTSFNLDERSLSNADSTTIGEIIREAIQPLFSHGRSRGFKVSSFSKSGIGIEEAGEFGYMNPVSILSNDAMGQEMAVEGLRKKIESLGLIDESWLLPVTSSHKASSRNINVYMKKNPFRDITRIHKGTMISVTGYHKGCLVIEADGEEFWTPIEEKVYWENNMKDDEYYFRMDTNNDGVPDPLQFLPSKAGIGKVVANGEDNYNVQPDLRRVSGHFFPSDTLSQEDFDVLDDEVSETSLGAIHSQEDFHRPEYPTFDIWGAPGNTPVDHDADISASMFKKEIDTIDNDDGVDAVPDEYPDGEYGDEDTPDDGSCLRADFQEALDELDKVEVISKMMEALGFDAASKDVDQGNVNQYANLVINTISKDKDKRDNKILKMLSKLGIPKPKEEGIKLAMEAVMEGKNIDFILSNPWGRKLSNRDLYLREISEVFPDTGRSK